MRKDDAVRLRHMLDVTREAMSFTHGRSRVDLNSDRQLVLSLVKEVEIIGEAAYQLSRETRASMPEAPWEDIIGSRKGTGLKFRVSIPSCSVTPLSPGAELFRRPA